MEADLESTKLFNNYHEWGLFLEKFSWDIDKSGKLKCRLVCFILHPPNQFLLLLETWLEAFHIDVLFNHPCGTLLFFVLYNININNHNDYYYYCWEDYWHFSCSELALSTLEFTFYEVLVVSKIIYIRLFKLLLFSPYSRDPHKLYRNLRLISPFLSGTASGTQDLFLEVMDTPTWSLSRSTLQQYRSTYWQRSGFWITMGDNTFDVSPIQVISS